MYMIKKKTVLVMHLINLNIKIIKTNCYVLIIYTKLIIFYYYIHYDNIIKEIPVIIILIRN